jgi:hypothetical protein
VTPICTGWTAIGTPDQESVRAAPAGAGEAVSEDPSSPTAEAEARTPANELGAPTPENDGTASPPEPGAEAEVPFGSPEVSAESEDPETAYVPGD